MNGYLTVTELAEKFETTPRAVRFYETKGLISPERIGTRRVYSYRDQARFTLIMRAKRLGFTLKDIKEYLSLYRADQGQVKQSRLLLEQIERRADELKQQQKDIRDALSELKEMRQLAIDNVDKHEQQAAKKK